MQLEVMYFTQNHEHLSFLHMTSEQLRKVMFKMGPIVSILNKELVEGTNDDSDN